MGTADMGVEICTASFRWSLARQIAVFCCDQGYNEKKQLTPNVGRQAWTSGSVIRASTRPFERSSAATGAESEQKPWRRERVGRNAQRVEGRLQPRVPAAALARGRRAPARRRGSRAPRSQRARRQQESRRARRPRVVRASLRRERLRRANRQPPSSPSSLQSRRNRQRRLPRHQSQSRPRHLRGQQHRRHQVSGAVA